MLTERYSQLITAYVDGELPSRQRRLAERLLQRSPEARRLCERLRADAECLRQLPTPMIPRDLSASLVSAIVKRGLSPRGVAPVRSRPQVPTWAGLAAAAAVIFVVGYSSYSYFASSLRGRSGQALVQQTPMTADATPRAGDHIPDPGGAGQSARSGLHPIPVPRIDPGQGSPEKDPLVEGPKAPNVPVDPEFELGPPMESAGPVLTDRGVEQFQIKVVELAPALILPVGDLDADSGRQKLVTELGKSDSFRIELPTTDATRSMERLLGACKPAGIQTIIDQLAQGRLKTGQWKTNYVLFSQTLTTDELVRLLQVLAQADKLAMAKKPSDGLLDRMVVTSMTRNDRRELGDLLGIAPEQLQRPRATGPLGTDLTRPLADQTTEQLAQLLPRQPGKPAEKLAEPNALVLSLPPARPNRGSAEIKRFLDGRKSIRTGSIQVMIVLRNVG